MKKIMLTIMSVLSSLLVVAQASQCANKLDTAGVIKIAKASSSGDWFTQPYIAFNEQTCEWSAVASKRQHTNKGRCKYTNGCTLVTSITLLIDAQTGKVKSRKKEKKIYPNYE